jgi:hypothetical protein
MLCMRKEITVSLTEVPAFGKSEKLILAFYYTAMQLN